MQTSKYDYSSLVKAISKNSPLPINMLNAFWSGGLICVLGQVITNMFLSQPNLTRDEVASATSVTLILLSAILTGAGIYPKLGKLCGAGTLVPITGFANSVVSAAIEYKSEGFITGLGVKIFTIAGPVIVYGTFASCIYGVILYLADAFM